MVKRAVFIVFMLLPLLLFMFLSVPAAMSAEITREAPEEAEPSSIVKISLTLSMFQPDAEITIKETLPSDFVFQSWDVEGTLETVEDTFVKIENNTYTWTLTPIDEFVVLDYYALVPSVSGNYTFSGIITDIDGEVAAESVIQVKGLTCGNDVCDEDEAEDSCPSDCISQDGGTATAVNEQAGNNQTLQSNASSSTDQSNQQQNNQPSAQTNSAPIITRAETSPEPQNDPFANKKKKGNSKLLVIFGSTTAVLGLTVFGIYIQSKKKKISSSSVPKDTSKETTEEVKETLARLKARSTAAPDQKSAETAKKDYIERASSELPSFSETISRIELPAMPSELRKTQKVVLSIPPIPRKDVKKITEPTKQLIQQQKKIDAKAPEGNIDDALDSLMKK